MPADLWTKMKKCQHSSKSKFFGCDIANRTQPNKLPFLSQINYENAPDNAASAATAAAVAAAAAAALAAVAAAAVAAAAAVVDNDLNEVFHFETER